MSTPRRCYLLFATVRLRYLALGLFAGLWFGAAASAAGPQQSSLPAIAIIIDDLGYTRAQGVDAFVSSGGHDLRNSAPYPIRQAVCGERVLQRQGGHIASADGIDPGIGTRPGWHHQ